jgi:hypothetical protein
VSALGPRRIELGTLRTAWHRCPGCGALHDAATHVAGPPEDPDDGSAFICWDCGILAIFDSTVEGGVRLPTGDEHRTARAERNVALALDVVANLIERRT